MPLAACSSDDTAATGSSGSDAAASATTGTGAASASSSSSSSASSTGAGGACAGGGTGGGCPCPNDVCPETLTRGLASAAQLEVGADDLFFVASIDRLPKAGGTPTEVVTGTIATYALDDAHLYWIDGSGTLLHIAALDGSAAAQLAAADGTQHPQAIALDADNVYFATVSTGPTGNCAGVKRIPKAGGTPVVVAKQCDMTSMLAPYGLVVDDTRVYWLTVKTPTFKDGTIYSADKTGTDGPVALVAYGTSPASHLLLDAATLFWLQDGITKVGVEGGSVTHVGTQAKVTSFTVDATSIYAVNGSGLTRIDKATEDIAPLAYEAGSEVAVDDAAIYWLSGNPGSVSVLTLPK